MTYIIKKVEPKVAYHLTCHLAYLSSLPEEFAPFVKSGQLRLSSSNNEILIFTRSMLEKVKKGIISEDKLKPEVVHMGDWLMLTKFQHGRLIKLTEEEFEQNYEKADDTLFNELIDSLKHIKRTAEIGLSGMPVQELTSIINVVTNTLSKVQNKENENDGK